MTIESTINISNTNKALLKKSSQQLHITINELITILLNKYLNQQVNYNKIFQRVKYQKLKQNEFWKTQHVWYSNDFYEKCLDLRRFHKFSLSNILSQAIELYLNEILTGEYDNYNKNYALFNSNYNNCTIFFISWDYPGNKVMEKIHEIFENT